jgi:hypothetical protein
MNMPFGKFRGQRITAIPGSYLVYLLENADLDDDLACAMRQELARRLGLARQHGAPPTRSPPVRDAVNGWFRRLVMKHHPDRGGDEKVMQALNDAHDQLKAALGLER